jgi:excisionase family DNA binding protein
MSREEAARYVGVSASTFDKLIADGRMPKPFRIGKRVIWDRLKIEAAFTDLGEEEEENVIDRALRLAAERRKP